MRAPVLTVKEPPRWFRGSLQRAYGVALDEWAQSGIDEARAAASWKLLLFVPRLLIRLMTKLMIPLIIFPTG